MKNTNLVYKSGLIVFPVNPDLCRITNSNMIDFFFFGDQPQLSCVRIRVNLSITIII